MSPSEVDNDFGLDILPFIEETLEFHKFGFQLTHSKVYSIKGLVHRRAIYDSIWCRIKFNYHRMYLPGQNELYIFYGRNHAPTDEYLMDWEGETCRSWHGHSLNHLHFLDGMSPREALRKERSSMYPKPLEIFFRSDEIEALRIKHGSLFPVIWEKVIWEHYGEKLFEMFDLRHPEIWKKYAEFLKEYYELKNEERISKGGAPYTHNPPRYKIC